MRSVRFSFNRKFRKFWEQTRTENKFLEIKIRNLGIPREVVLFFGDFFFRSFSIQLSTSYNLLTVYTAYIKNGFISSAQNIAIICQEAILFRIERSPRFFVVVRDVFETWTWTATGSREFFSLALVTEFFFCSV